ncbi:MAG: hypothetical protein WEB52_09690 [Dehalococcoidia bacterium]
MRISLLWLFVLAALILHAGPQQAFACSCGGSPPTDDELMRARLASSERALVVAIVEGPVEAKPIDGSRYATLPGAAFRAERVYRGDVPARFEMGYVTCTRPPEFTRGSRWLVEMTQFEGRWQSDLCSITTEVGSRQGQRYVPSINRILGTPPLLPNDDGGASMLTVALAVAGLGAAAGAAGYVARRWQREHHS